MFKNYVFTSSVSSEVECENGSNDKVKLSLKKLDEYLSGSLNTFENTPFNIEMARFFVHISNVENVVFDLLTPDGRFNYSKLYDNILDFVAIIPEKINVEIIEPDFDKSGLGAKLECSIFNNISKVVSSNRSLTRLIKSNYKIKPVPTSILGSCCSRDMLTYYHKYNKSSNFKVELLTMNVSFSTLFDLPLKFSMDDLNISKENIKTTLSIDLVKSIPNTIVQSLKTDSIVILDFMDERFDLIEYKNSKVTKSWDFMNTKLYKKLKGATTVSFDSDSKIDAVIDNAKRLISFLANYIPQKNIIVNESIMSNFFFDDNGFNLFDESKYNFSRYNMMQAKVIETLKNEFNHITFVSSPDYLNFGDVHHQWGTHPYHFNEAYYLYKIKKILLGTIS